jgi:murein DD-endopeptidase MepM/ murein hydrolase activator NlpD
MKRIPTLAPIVFLLLMSAGQARASSPYPEIRVLSQDDALFVQQQAALGEFRKLSEVRGQPELPSLDIFSYVKRQADDLFSLNARIGVRYDTLATLNGATSKDAFNAKQRILIPSQDGVFINNPPRNDLEAMMLSTRLADGKLPLPLVVARDGRKAAVYYFPGETFTPMERSYFLGILFRLPIDTGRITSMYGWRPDPFTGKSEFHTGLDFGAAEGTEVRAARDGVVEEIGANDALGNYVIITHPGGWQTVYGHLSSIRVIIREKVGSGALIGGVGHSGRATGSHLHFEVRTKSGTTDPFRLLAVKKY